jgi:hypothetical protein
VAVGSNKLTAATGERDESDDGYAVRRRHVAPHLSAAGERTRVHVLATDGCRPDEVTAELTPNLHALRQADTWYPNAPSLPVMETIPTT